MSAIRLFAVFGLAVAIGAVAPARARADDDDDRRKAAAVIGAVVGAIALSAASKNHRHENHRPHGGQRHAYQAPFSPAANVTCYPRQHTCYRRNGRIAGRWTNRIYGG